jgi:hypothetical protein
VEIQRALVGWEIGREFGDYLGKEIRHENQNFGNIYDRDSPKQRRLNDDE